MLLPVINPEAESDGSMHSAPSSMPGCTASNGGLVRLMTASLVIPTENKTMKFNLSIQ